LLGRQAEAQADYRAALTGPDGEEARRRLALSLAISGNRTEALQVLSPLIAQRDVAAGRTRAFVLALSGDSAGAMAAINVAMPGSSGSVAPFLQRLPSLQAGQKAAAVNLGVFPGDTYASAASAGVPTVISSSETTNRLAGIDDLLRQPAPQQPAVQASYTPRPLPRPAAVAFQPKIWLQLGSGENVDELATRYKRLKAKSQEMLDGIKPYVARSPDGTRLVIGPFRGPSDAQMMAEGLETAGIDVSRWSNSQSDRIAPLVAE
jgi:hypothetical protein